MLAGPMRQAPGTCTASITPGREGDESPTGDNALACRPLTASAHADGKRRDLRGEQSNGERLWVNRAAVALQPTRSASFVMLGANQLQCHDKESKQN